jgi:D-beta-D-heptose 7-phosphate kinase/D-beta-D-heptose 1-phosphate adenosyltransferase
MVINLKTLGIIRQSGLFNGARVVVTNGVFDILHRGHVSYLKTAKRLGSHLIVGINSDRATRILKGENRPVNPELDRAEVLDSLKMIDFVCVFDDVLACDFLEKAWPDIYVKGGDYKIHTLNRQEYSTLNKIGSEINIISYIEGISTTNIIDKLQNQTKLT